MKLKNEKEALQMFCNEESRRVIFQHPFIIDKSNGRVIASDGHMMALVDKKLLRCKYNSIEQTLPGLDYERKDFAKVIEFATVDKAYNQFDLIPEVKSKDGKPKECPECYGTGNVEYEYTDGEGIIHYKDCDCPICDGTGERSDFEPVETGRMILPKNSTFGLGNHIISAQLLWRVVTALRMMGFERMTWKSEQKGVCIFDVCDGFIVLIMPIPEQGESHKNIAI